MLSDIAQRLSAELCGPAQWIHFLDQRIEVAPARIHDLQALMLRISQLPAFQFSALKGATCIGLGQAATVNTIDTTLPEGVFVWRACAFPSMREQARDKHPDWSEITANTYVLPAIGIVCDDEKAHLFACGNVDIDAVLPKDKLVDGSEPIDELFEIGDASLMSPDLSAWSEAIRYVTREMDATNTKVVFARKTTYQQSPPPFSVLRHLQSKQTRYSGMVRTPNSSFAFASPERLFMRRGKELYTEAVAGTRKLGATAEEQRALRDNLLNSHKDLREHAIVAEDICEQLSDICENVELDGPSILVSSTVQHLYTRIQASLLANKTDVDIVNALHPTPAVLGKQREWALQKIEALEPWERGLYAGAIGVHIADTAEYCVAIRSVLVQNNALHVFTGAGIVEDSQPEAEWDEIQQKLQSVVGR